MLDFPLFPESASTMADQVDAMYLFLVAVSAFFSLLIAASIVYTAVRYRRREEDEIGGTFHANLLLEITWTVIPLAIVLFIFFWGARVFFAQQRPPDDAVEYTAIGKQWMWKFQHPDGRREINTLHVPVGEPVKLKMISQDVIHSFYVPAFRVKQDVLPGRYTTVWFEATKPGTYHLFCAEYCGTEHSRMTGQVIVQEPRQHEAWLAGGPAMNVSPEESGEQLFADMGCNTCHRQNDTGRGPSLIGVAGSTVELADGRTIEADDDYLRRSILDPTAEMVAGYQPLMPTYKGQISEEDVIRLIAYIESLSGGRERPARSPAAPGDEPTTASGAAGVSAGRGGDTETTIEVDR